MKQGIAVWVWALVTAILIAILVTLIGVIRGGVAGMHFHGEVDKADLDA